MQQIINFIEAHKMGSSEVADALDKSGSIQRLKAVNQGCCVVGTVFPVYAIDGSNWHLHKQIQNTLIDSIVYVHTLRCDKKAVLGALVADYLFEHKHCKGLIVNGFIRDLPHLIQKKYPIWCFGYNPVGCVNDRPIYDEQGMESIMNKLKGVMVCDDTGVVHIPLAKKHNILEKLHSIRERETSWFNRLVNGESTFSIVCGEQ